MKIGLIARADSTGLGIQSKEFYDHIPCESVLVIDSSRMPGAVPHIHQNDFSKYDSSLQWTLKPGPPVSQIPYDLIKQFVSGVDLVFAMETPYDYNIFKLCRQIGIKTILQFNYEFLDFAERILPGSLPAPDLFAAPSMWNYDRVPDPKTFLPVPVNVNRFVPVRKPKHFVHVVGRPAMQDRSGTQTLLRALQFVKSEITVTLRSQQPVPMLLKPRENVKLNVEFGNKQDYSDNYTGGVFVLPRKFGGLCLPFNEAIGAEMPVIATDISPNNLWLPKEWLVPSTKVGVIPSKRQVDFYEASAVALAEKIDHFCDEDFYNAAVEKAIEIKKSISWTSLLPLYNHVFESLVQNKPIGL